MGENFASKIGRVRGRQRGDKRGQEGTEGAKMTARKRKNSGAEASLKTKLTRYQQEWAGVVKDFRSSGENAHLVKRSSLVVRAQDDWQKKMTALKREHAGLLENISKLEKALETERSKKKAKVTTRIEKLGIEITTTSDVNVCDQWFKAFRESKLPWIGLDIEWKANTVKGQVPNPVATLQLGTQDKALILQLLHFKSGFSKALKKLLADEKVKKIGVGIEEDFTKLEKQGLVCKGAKDLSSFFLTCQGLVKAEGKRWPYPYVTVKPWEAAGLKRLAKLVLGINFNKPKNFWKWDWSKKNLPNHMREYAARDAVLAVRAIEAVTKATCKAINLSVANLTSRISNV